MRSKFVIVILLGFYFVYGSLHAQSIHEVTLAVKLNSASCGDFCYYDFNDLSTGKEIKLEWNTKWDQQKKAYTFPDLDAESVRIMDLIVNCAQQSYSEGTNSSYCQEVLGKTFIVKAVKKTREEVVATGPETWEKTGEIENYYKIKNIRTQNQGGSNLESQRMESKEKEVIGRYVNDKGFGFYIQKINGELFTSYLNDLNEKYKLNKDSYERDNKYEYSYVVKNQGGTFSTTYIGFSNNELYALEISRGQGYEDTYKKDPNDFDNDIILPNGRYTGYDNINKMEYNFELRRIINEWYVDYSIKYTKSGSVMQMEPFLLYPTSKPKTFIVKDGLYGYGEGEITIPKEFKIIENSDEKVVLTTPIYWIKTVSLIKQNSQRK